MAERSLAVELMNVTVVPTLFLLIFPGSPEIWRRCTAYSRSGIRD
jgi:hypothetical protein